MARNLEYGVTTQGETRAETLEEFAAAITDGIGIRLEYEAAYDRTAFVPKPEKVAGV